MALTQDQLEHELVTGGISPQAAVQLAAATPGTAVTATAALTGQTAIPAGGTGAAAGGWDTAPHRDSAITTIGQMQADILALRTTIEAMRTVLVAAGITS